MTLNEVSEMIDGIGIPNAYYQFANNTGISPPFIIFYYPENLDLIADGVNYCKINRLVIELCTDNKDFSLEEKIENTLNENGLVYQRSETYLDSEQMYEVIFLTSVVITED